RRIRTCRWPGLRQWGTKSAPLSLTSRWAAYTLINNLRNDGDGSPYRTPDTRPGRGGDHTAALPRNGGTAADTAGLPRAALRDLPSRAHSAGPEWPADPGQR